MNNTKKELVLVLKKKLQGEKDFVLLVDMIKRKFNELGSRILGERLIWRGEWTEENYYVAKDLSEYGGSVYICIKDCKGKEPLNSGYWNLFVAKGSKGDKGDAGVKITVAPTAPRRPAINDLWLGIS